MDGNSFLSTQNILCLRPNRTRAREAELAEAARDAAREKDILEEIDTVGLPRCEALGFDRHWNRYWLLGAWEDNKGGAQELQNSTTSLCGPFTVRE